MKTLKPLFTLLLITIMTFSCKREPIDFEIIEHEKLHSDSTVNTNDTNNIINLENSDIRWWILVHPSYGNEGIYLYNETKSIIEKSLPLPDLNFYLSPHALDFDGEFLWLGGHGDSAGLFKLNPADGSVISKIENIATEGIACVNGDIYYATSNKIVKINQGGEKILEVSTSLDNGPICDIAFSNSSLYYAYNGVEDPVIKINPASSIEEKITNTGYDFLYTLAVFQNNLIIVAQNQIRRLDIHSGEIISQTAIPINGWITAITPYRIF